MTKILITQFDYDRLMKLLDKRKPHDDFDKSLLAELEKGEIIEPKDVPDDVITMNSQVSFTDEHGDDWKYWLVFPDDSDLTKQKISILSPIGCALIGYSKGDTITLPTPKGRRQLTVEEIIHQPEREGNFDL
ncbi:MAG: nucleoside diphosphate kinase regulator [Candidatus Saccharimonadales bacterium]